MKNTDLQKMTVSQLVDQFRAFALAQFEAELNDEITKYNRLYDKIVAVKDELKGRAGDQRSALVPLLSDPNPQVRLKAAQWALAVEPVAARQTLQEISDRNEYPQAAYARQTLMAIERGDSRLT
ncbi:MAG: DUF2019 domain-containing protein [Pseudolabrys sp.]|nr:DUF2019 domain-containing protein [Pseudolabrys sp.]